MSKVTVYGNITFDEMEDFRLVENDNETTYIHDEYNVQVQFFHKKVNPVMLAIADKKSMRSQVAQDFKKANPSFNVTETYAYMVDGKKYYGLRYTMEVASQKLVADTILLTRGGNYYVITCKAPEEHSTFMADAFAMILGSMKL